MRIDPKFFEPLRPKNWISRNSGSRVARALLDGYGV